MAVNVYLSQSSGGNYVGRTKTWFHIKHIVLAKNTAGSMEENN